MGRTGLAFHRLHEGAPAVLLSTPRQTMNLPASFQPLFPISVVVVVVVVVVIVVVVIVVNVVCVCVCVCVCVFVCV
jgi:hypothetical protein